MTRTEEALSKARDASKLHRLLSKFFTEQTTETIEDMKTCAHEELLDNRAYLLAIDRLECDLLEHINEYNLIEARSVYVSNRSNGND